MEVVKENAEGATTNTVHNRTIAHLRFRSSASRDRQ